MAMPRNRLDALACEYMIIKECLLAAGYEWEIDWQTDRSFDNTTEQEFLQESAWVVLSTGFKEIVIRSYFPAVSRSFCNWRDSVEICSQLDVCVRDALEVFGNARKIRAIAEIVRIVAKDGWCRWKTRIRQDGPMSLQAFPFIGPVTCHHLAKNIGLACAKPDRHLVRLAERCGYCTPNMLCKDISEIVGDSVAVVDLVLWRYATLTAVPASNNAGLFDRKTTLPTTPNGYHT